MKKRKVDERYKHFCDKLCCGMIVFFDDLGLIHSEFGPEGHTVS